MWRQQVSSSNGHVRQATIQPPGRACHILSCVGNSQFQTATTVQHTSRLTTRRMDSAVQQRDPQLQSHFRSACPRDTLLPHLGMYIHPHRTHHPRQSHLPGHSRSGANGAGFWPSAGTRRPPPPPPPPPLPPPHHTEILSIYLATQGI